MPELRAAADTTDVHAAETPNAVFWQFNVPCSAASAAARTRFVSFPEPERWSCDETFAFLPATHAAIYLISATMAARPPADLNSPAMLTFSELGVLSTRSPTLSSRIFGAPLGNPAAIERLEEIEVKPVQQPAAADLRTLLRWTDGSAELLAALLGASRRSIYNWLKGSPPRGRFAARCVRLRAVLAPLGEEWHPQALAQWLQEGSPARDLLIREERWAELDEQVRRACAAVQPEPKREPEAVPAAPVGLSEGLLRAALEEFRSPPPAPVRSREGWRPRELTGASPDLDEKG